MTISAFFNCKDMFSPPYYLNNDEIPFLENPPPAPSILTLHPSDAAPWHPDPIISADKGVVQKLMPTQNRQLILYISNDTG